MRDERVEFVLLPPSGLAMLPPVPLPDLKVVTVAGEPFSQELVKRWAPGRRFFNLYGPTESTILSLVAECRAGDERVLIGRPIPNSQAYVLDRNLQPVPLGVAGELFLGGPGVGRGYLNRPELTLERFVPDPFSSSPDARLYKTGDLVRYRLDGNLEFLGRTDQQVKLRGYRIEPGEIEACLTLHPGVRDSVVVPRQDWAGDKQLVAYVVRRTEDPVSATELLQFLRSKLPRFMVPAAFVWLDRLPLSPSGKVDRSSLPEPDFERAPADALYVAPRTELERGIAAVWQEVLELDRVSVHDNFFDVGGHSLKMVRMHSRLNEVLDTEISIVDLFQYPTIASLAGFVTNGRDSSIDLGDLQDRVEKQKLVMSQGKRS
jgi:acyl-coenzyme A synthetase/AMP-(fatty) acid ligase/acyl carrier protein